MGTSASSFLHRHDACRRGYEQIPRWHEEEKDDHNERIPRHDEDEEQHEHHHQEEPSDILFFEEERQGPAALEARGRMQRDRARRRQGTVFETWLDLRDSALCYLVALNWRQAALGFIEQAMYDLQLGDERRATTVLLRSAKCYIEIENKSKGDVEYVEKVLEEATALFVRVGNLRLAATSCLELAEFYMDQQDLRSALCAFERASGYCGCGHKSGVVRLLLRDEEVLRRRGMLPFKNYKRRSTGYIRSSDPHWRTRVSEFFLSTTPPVRPRM